MHYHVFLPSLRPLPGSRPPSTTPVCTFPRLFRVGRPASTPSSSSRPSTVTSFHLPRCVRRDPRGDYPSHQTPRLSIAPSSDLAPVGTSLCPCVRPDRTPDGHVDIRKNRDKNVPTSRVGQLSTYRTHPQTVLCPSLSTPTCSSPPLTLRRFPARPDRHRDLDHRSSPHKVLILRLRCVCATYGKPPTLWNVLRFKDSLLKPKITSPPRPRGVGTLQVHTSPSWHSPSSPVVRARGVGVFGTNGETKTRTLVTLVSSKMCALTPRVRTPLYVSLRTG